MVTAVVLALLLVLAVGGVVALIAKSTDKLEGKYYLQLTSREPGTKHKHDWRYHSSAYNPPSDRVARGLDITTMERMIHGFTNVTYTCAVDECPEVKVQTFIGRVSDPHPGQEYKP